jgi:hypothetical protein
LRDGGVAMKNILGVTQIISTKNLTSSHNRYFGGIRCIFPFPQELGIFIDFMKKLAIIKLRLEGVAKRLHERKFSSSPVAFFLEEPMCIYAI